MQVQTVNVESEKCRRGIMFDGIVEAIIKDAMERGEFDSLPGQGKPIDLTEYFETPEEVRVAHSILKNAGMTSREVELLKEIAELKQVHAALLDEKKRQEIEKQIQQKQIELNLMLERQKRERSKK
jgi:hypothetical protein